MRRKLFAVYEYVVTDQERVFHQPEGISNACKNERDIEQPRHQHRCQRARNSMVVFFPVACLCRHLSPASFRSKNLLGFSPTTFHKRLVKDSDLLLGIVIDAERWISALSTLPNSFQPCLAQTLPQDFFIPTTGEDLQLPEGVTGSRFPPDPTPTARLETPDPTALAVKMR